MSERSDDIYSRIIGIIDETTTRIDRTTYRLKNDKIIMLRYSKLHENGGYWFGFGKDRFESFPLEKFYILFICGTEHQVLVTPATYLNELLNNVNTAVDNNWKIHIFNPIDKFEISVTGKPKEDITSYLNNYKILAVKSEYLSNDKPKDEKKCEIFEPPISVEDQIIGIDAVNGSSLHDRIIDMLRQIGEWTKYRAITNYKVRSDSPYSIDIAWLLDNALHIAIEVQIGGNVTEAKDRLIFARRFGARKCIIVSNYESMDRINSLFKYETEIKHWTEIWGLERIYNMFVDGRNFYENFNEFNKHQYRDDIVEII
jgi:hypothetical protein